MTLPDFSSLPFWQLPELPRETSSAPSALSRGPELALTVHDHERLYRHYVPDLSARPVAGKEHRGRCPIHGTAESGANFSVDLQNGRCRCLSRGCVEGYVYELVAALNGWVLPKELPKVKAEVRRLLGLQQSFHKAQSKAGNSSSRLQHGEPERDPRAADWKSRLIRTVAGSPRPILSNVVLAFRSAPELRGLVGWDEFALRTVLLRMPPWEGGLKPGDSWTEEYDSLAAIWLQREGIVVSKTLVIEAVQVVAHENGFHPVRDYLESLRWDGDPRIDNFLPDYFGCPCSEFAAAVGPRWLIGGVSRIYKPGSKVDTMLILEGVQGLGKSRALSVLGGKWFTDNLGDLRTKEAAEQIQGKWIIEVAELDSLHRAEESAIKSFLSRSQDRFRPAYGRRAIDAPRQSIFAGTTNGDGYLKDSTGGRRFWPIRCGAIALARLEEDRNQLWAEAVQRYKEGGVWWLSSDMEVHAKAEQEARRQPDPWEALISNWFAQRDRNGETTVSEILNVCLEKHKGAIQRADESRVGACLRALGFQRVREQVDGQRKYIYRIQKQDGQG